MHNTYTTIPGHHAVDIESLIDRVRLAINMGMPVEEIVAHFVNTDMGASPETMFLVYTGARLLEEWKNESH